MVLPRRPRELPRLRVDHLRERSQLFRAWLADRVADEARSADPMAPWPRLDAHEAEASAAPS